MGIGNWLKRGGASFAVQEVCQYKSGYTHNSKISQSEGGDLSQHNDCGDVYDCDEDDDDDDDGGGGDDDDNDDDDDDDYEEW